MCVFFVLPCYFSYLVGIETLALVVLFDLFVTAEGMRYRVISTSKWPALLLPYLESFEKESVASGRAFFVFVFGVEEGLVY